MSIAQTQTHVEAPSTYTLAPIVSQQNAPTGEGWLAGHLIEGWEHNIRRYILEVLTGFPPITEVLTLRLVPRRQRKKVCKQLLLQESIVWFLIVLRSRVFCTQAVRWAEDVVDNEFLGKKKSKSTLFPLMLAC